MESNKKDVYKMMNKPVSAKGQIEQYREKTSMAVILCSQGITSNTLPLLLEELDKYEDNLMVLESVNYYL